MSIRTSEGSGQQTYVNVAYSKPLTPRDGNHLLNPSIYMNSKLNMYNKRLFQAPNNFIGFKGLRPANMQPNRQQTPHMNRQPAKEGIPILKTEPVPRTFH